VPFAWPFAGQQKPVVNRMFLQCNKTGTFLHGPKRSGQLHTGIFNELFFVWFYPVGQIKGAIIFSHSTKV
jgi:hypothetical protein